MFNLEKKNSLITGGAGLLGREHAIALSKCKRDITLDPENYYQITEVGNISWFTLNEALERIRPYNVEKKEVLKKVNKLLINNNC